MLDCSHGVEVSGDRARGRPLCGRGLQKFWILPRGRLRAPFPPQDATLPPMNEQEPPTPEPGDAELLGPLARRGPVGLRAPREAVRRPAPPPRPHPAPARRRRAEDTVQEAFLRVAKTPAGPRGGAKTSPWTGSSAPGCIESRGTCAWMSCDQNNGDAPARRSERARRTRSRRAAVEALDTRSAVEHSISSLPDDQREVVSLRLLEECSYAEIASITGRNVGHGRLADQRRYEGARPGPSAAHGGLRR